MRQGDVSLEGRPWHQLDNLIMTPHASGWTWAGAEGRRVTEVARNLDALAKGEPLINVV
eukprot:SAG25_NODE_9987_length_349_cov_1.232000_1_plen_58_part_01